MSKSNIYDRFKEFKIRNKEEYEKIEIEYRQFYTPLKELIEGFHINNPELSDFDFNGMISILAHNFWIHFILENYNDPQEAAQYYYRLKKADSGAEIEIIEGVLELTKDEKFIEEFRSQLEKEMKNEH